MPPTPDQLYSQTLAGYQNQAATYTGNTQRTNKGYQQLYDQQAQFGASQHLALQQQRDRLLSSQQQSMLSRGLGNSTVLDAGARGINYDYANSLLTLNDQLFQRQNQIKQAQLGYQAQAAQGMAGIQSGELGFQGGYAQAAQGIQAQYGMAGAQSQYALSQQAAQQQAQQQQMQEIAQNNAKESAQQFNQQSALNNQQGQIQSNLQGMTLQAQAAQQQAGFDQQNYASEQFGYY